jgi:DNA-binding response OmpR family regulator
MEQSILPKIMIIDDDQFLLDMYAIKFGQSQFEVATSLGSESAVKKLQAGFTPDVILLDIMMPVMNGFEFLEKINTEHLAESAVKIILSNRGDQNDIARGKELGASGYIVKASTTPAEVIAQVTTIMNQVK